MDFHTNCYKQPPGLAELTASASSSNNTSSGRRTNVSPNGADCAAPQRRQHRPNIDPQQQLDSPDYTFTLPDISIYADDFRRFLEKDLIEGSTLSSLEQAQRLNWWTEAGYCRKLWPLATSGDGNCLLHAASLALWGFHDRKLTLRTALHAVLTHSSVAASTRDALWRRWRFQQTRLNKRAGFVYSEMEWSHEWEVIVALASPEPRQSPAARNSGTNNGTGTTSSADRKHTAAAAASSAGASNHHRRRSMVMDTTAMAQTSASASDATVDENATYESLEEIHILALAHVLRRTIIVVADTVLRDMNGEAMAPIPFGGVYLPFEIPAGDCHRAPLLLTYDMAHFSALVSMECHADQAAAESDAASSGVPPACIPLLDVDNVLLPIQFCIDPGADFAWTEYDGTEGNWALSDREHVALLREYLDVVHVSPVGRTPDEELLLMAGEQEAFGGGGAGSDEEFDGQLLMLQQLQHEGTGGTVADGPNGRSKAAKQLQSVAKQFGSIGKSMSKKIKKNIGSITKIGSSTASSNGKAAAAAAAGGSSKKSSLSSGTSMQSIGQARPRILCAQLKAKRYDYQEEMIRNYLECAQERFLDGERVKQLAAMARIGGSNGAASTATHNASGSPNDYTDGSGSTITGGGGGGSAVASASSRSQTYLLDDEAAVATCCINAGCQNYGTAATSYMCHECFEKQKEQELNAALAMDPVARYGTGNSRFYTQSDQLSHQQIQRIPSVKRLNELDQTLYLSNSTFYNDQRHQPTTHQQPAPAPPLPPPSSLLQSQHDIEQQYLQNGFRTASAYTTPASVQHSNSHRDDPAAGSRSSSTNGSASAFSPGRTIIHHIVRQTVQLPPLPSTAAAPPPNSTATTTATVADAAQLVPRAAYEIGAGNNINNNGLLLPDAIGKSSSVAAAMGGIVTPFGQARTCRTDGCMFYGCAASDYYCSKCCQKQQQLQQSSKQQITSLDSGGSRTQSKVLTDV